MNYRQYPNIAVSDMNGESSTFHALRDLREVDARKLRNWRLLALAAFWVVAMCGYWWR